MTFESNYDIQITNLRVTFTKKPGSKARMDIMSYNRLSLIEHLKNLRGLHVISVKLEMGTLTNDEIKKLIKRLQNGN